MMIDFSKQLLHWYSMYKRDLPWRMTKDPYSVWVSEIILQQTRVDQGLAYYQRFMETWPDVFALANATEHEVLKLWQGLGYYSRARNMHSTAQRIAGEFKGSFPSDYKMIKALKGVGPYTAAAIGSIAFDLPYPVVDGNVQRVLSRIFGVTEALDEKSGKQMIDSLAYQLLDADEPGNYNQALMEFGALQCLPVAPVCEHCIFKEKCFAFNNSKVASIPYKARKLKQKIRYFHYFWTRWTSVNQNLCLIHKRLHNDIWKGLFEFPMIETACPVDFDELQHTKAFQNIFRNQNFHLRYQSEPKTHLLTHQKIIAKFYHLNFEHPFDLFTENQLSLINQSELGKYPIPRLIDRYLQEHDY